MPRVVPSGGFSERKRRRYTVRHKLGILARLGRLQEVEGLSLRNAALRLGVEKSSLSDWRKLLSAGAPLLHGMKKKAAHDGPLGQFAPIEDDLLRFIFELREQGMAVSSLMIVIKASILSAE